MKCSAGFIIEPGHAYDTASYEHWMLECSPGYEWAMTPTGYQPACSRSKN